MYAKGATFLDRPMANITAGEMGQMISETARRSNSYALDIASTNIRSDLTAKDVKRFAREGEISYFQRNGQMTKEARQYILDTIKMMFNIKSTSKAKKITVEQYINRMLTLDYLKKDIKLDAIKKGFKVIV